MFQLFFFLSFAGEPPKSEARKANSPSEPLRLIGEISEMYMGTSVVFKPQFKPIMNRPKIKHSKLRKYLLELSKVAPTIANTLLSKRPHFLERERKGKRLVWLKGKINKSEFKVAELMGVCCSNESLCADGGWAAAISGRLSKLIS